MYNGSSLNLLIKRKIGNEEANICMFIKSRIKFIDECVIMSYFLVKDFLMGDVHLGWKAKQTDLLVNLFKSCL